MKSTTVSLAACGLLLALAEPASAQKDRRELVNRARTEFSDSLRMQVLLEAMDPGVAPLDSVWAVGVYDFASTLLVDRADRVEALLWLRWAVRTGPQWPIDPAWFLPDAVAAYGEAKASIDAGQDAPDGRVATAWKWPARLVSGAPGVLSVQGREATPGLTISIEGGTSVASGDSVTLEPGTYRLSAAAPGFETAETTREILPGVTTQLIFDLPPLLPPEIEEAVSGGLIRIRSTRGGGTQCATGIARGGGRVLVPSHALPAGKNVRVLDAHGVDRDAIVIGADGQLGVAVLQIRPALEGAILSGRLPASEVYAWAISQNDCSLTFSSRTRIGPWPAEPLGLVSLQTPVQGAEAGAALVDRDGRLVGVLVDNEHALPVLDADRLLATAVAETNEGPDVGTTRQLASARGRGRSRLLWVGAGVAVAGVAAAVLGSKGSSPGNEGTTARTGIRVTFPGG